MNLTLVQDEKGNQKGVFIPLKEWDIIKKNYPDIEFSLEDISDWEKKLIDDRLDSIDAQPEIIKPGIGLINELNKKI